MEDHATSPCIVYRLYAHCALQHAKGSVLMGALSYPLATSAAFLDKSSLCVEVVNDSVKKICVIAQLTSESFLPSSHVITAEPYKEEYFNLTTTGNGVTEESETGEVLKLKLAEVPEDLPGPFSWDSFEESEVTVLELKICFLSDLRIIRSHLRKKAPRRSPRLMEQRAMAENVDMNLQLATAGRGSGRDYYLSPFPQSSAS